MKLRTRISVYLILFGMIPLLVAFVTNVPMIFDRIEVLYHKAHLQNLRAEFGDLDQHLARRHEMARLLAKIPEPGLMQAESSAPPAAELLTARKGYAAWVNQVLIDQFDVTQVLFLDESGKQVFWLERNITDGQIVISKASHPSVNPRLLEASKTLRPGVVLNGPIIFDYERGKDAPNRFMQMSLISPVVIPLLASDDTGEMIRQRGMVIVYLDLGGLASAYRGNYWVLGDGSYLPSDSGETRAGSAFEDFQGLQELFERRELALWEFGSQQVLWVPLFETQDAGTLWVGRSVDASPLSKLQRAVELRVALVAMGLLLVVLVVARMMALRVERFGQDLTTGISRVLENSEEVVFAWSRPEELHELGNTLTQLAATHAGHTRALHDYAEELERSNRYKSEFLANVSHELRTPLNSILLLSRMLADSNPASMTDEQRRQAQVINAAGSDLKALIDNILDLSRIEARQMTLVAEPVNLYSLLDSTLELMKPQIEQKRLDLQVDRDPAVPVTISSDADKLRQILINFLSNAVKFTERGGITVSLHPGAGREGKHYPVCISVRDTGIGIAEGKQSLIFEAFRQADGSTSRRFGGTGLGLSISRELARLMGGEIIVDSSSGAGATFTLCLPLELPSESVGVEDRPASVATAGSDSAVAVPAADYGGARVLLVDDDVRNLLALTPLLERWGLQVMAAGDGQEALDTLSTDGKFDLVIMDIMMPGMDGNETTRRIRQQAQFAGLPVIALTARAGTADLQQCRAAGADDCVVKPIDAGVLKSVLDNYLPATAAAGDGNTSTQ
jgi:signal transduction histidine kinase/ActR/RegA family two-component response regulator